MLTIAWIKLQQELNERDNLLRAQVFVEQAEKIDRENKALREAIAEQLELCKPSVNDVIGDFKHRDGGDMAKRRDSRDQARLDCSNSCALSIRASSVWSPFMHEVLIHAQSRL